MDGMRWLAGCAAALGIAGCGASDLLLLPVSGDASTVDASAKADVAMPYDVGASPAADGVASTDAPVPSNDLGPFVADAGSMDAAAPHPADGGTVVPPNDVPGPPPPADAGSPPPPADAGTPTCPQAVEVIIYDQGGWNALATALQADPSPCAHYWLSIPSLSADRTALRGAAEAAGIRARGPRFHALAEFSWGGWAAVGGMTWFDKGVEFRRRMDSAWYDVAAGDAWEINELPSTARTDAATRANVREAMRGLYTGPAGARAVRGAVFVIGMGEGTTNLATYKQHLENWLQDAAFWVDANSYARWWGQEVYPDPTAVCVGSATVAERAASLNAFTEHLPRLAASVGSPTTVNTAQSYLGRAYVPLLTAVWQSAAYQTDALTLDQMEHFVSTQVYATRAWSAAHTVPDGRIAFAWDNPTPGSATLAPALAARLASSIAGAYGDGGGMAARACSPSGAYTWCQCAVAGAAFNGAWEGFGTW